MVFRIKKCAWEEKEKLKVYESGEESESFKQQKVFLISCEQSSHAFHFVKVWWYRIESLVDKPQTVSIHGL